MSDLNESEIVSMHDYILPNFIIGGAAKCGTTTLHAYLGTHPDICVSSRKEVHFFDTDARYERGLEHYASFFSHCKGKKAIGESSPAYLHGRYIAERINRDLPGVKLIFIFRDPVKRAYSSYWHGYRAGRPMGTFRETIDDPANRHIYERGRYWKYLEDYFEVLGEERCQCLLTEQLAAEPRCVMSSVFRFLGVDDSFETLTLGEYKNTHWMPRSMAIQRLYFRTVVGGIKNKQNNWEFDEEGRIVARNRMGSFPLVRRGIGWAIRRFNTKPAVYPPMTKEDAELVQQMYKNDNKRFAELTGLDIEKWWTYV